MIVINGFSAFVTQEMDLQNPIFLTIYDEKTTYYCNITACVGACCLDTKF